MGNEQQKPQQTEAIAVTLNHPKFQNAKIISERNHKLLQTTFGVDQDQYQKWKNSFKSVNLDATHLLLPVKQKLEQSGLCGTTGTLKLYFENYSYLLTQEICSRKKSKKEFLQTDLWYLLLALSSAQQQMKTKAQSKVGDIRPQNIFLNSQGEVKVGCSLSWPRQHTNFNKTFDNEQTYLSPEDLLKLEMGTFEDMQSYKSEVFSIGLTLLSAGMLEDFINLYTIRAKSCRFNSEKATLLKNEWRTNTAYSQILTAIVSNLCQFKMQQRLDDDQLWQWISQFQDEIKNRQDFFIQSAPPKIQKEIQQIRRLFSAGQPSTQQPQAIVNPLSNYNPSLIHPSIREVINPKYVESYHEPVPKSQLSPVQRSPSNNKRENQQFKRLEEPRNKLSENVTVKNLLNYRQIEQAGRAPQQRYTKNISVAGFNNYSALVNPLTYNSQNDKVGQRKVKSNNLSYPISLAYNQQAKLPSNLIGRATNQAQAGNGGLILPFNQQYVLQHQRLAREHYLVSTGSTNEGGKLKDEGLSYFQKVIDPLGVRGGSIQQTVYIRKPDYVNRLPRK